MYTWSQVSGIAFSAPPSDVPLIHLRWSSDLIPLESLRLSRRTSTSGRATETRLAFSLQPPISANKPFHHPPASGPPAPLTRDIRSATTIMTLPPK